jgi:hypothetical protein
MMRLAFLLSVLAAPALADLPRGPVIGSVSPDPASDVAAELGATCAGTPEIGPAFQRLVDVDGDGRQDAVLDWRGLTCDGRPGSCGTGGCRAEVWLATPEGDWRLVLRERVHEVQVPFPGLLVLILDREDCDPEPVGACFRAFDARGGTLRELR